jgi:hypothetical protein
MIKQAREIQSGVAPRMRIEGRILESRHSVARPSARRYAGGSCEFLVDPICCNAGLVKRIRVARGGLNLKQDNRRQVEQAPHEQVEWPFFA